jgi:hypothetical protein
LCFVRFSLQSGLLSTILGEGVNMEMKKKEHQVILSLPEQLHQDLVSAAEERGEPVDDLIVQLLQAEYGERVPNEETRRAIGEVERGENLIRAKDLSDFMRHMND